MGKRYRHFKGNEYELICRARHTETEEDIVVYQALYGDGLIWARPAEMFFSDVDTPQGKVPRFAGIPDMVQLKIDDDMYLRHLKASDGPAIFAIIDRYRDEMRTWLPFVDTTVAPEDSIAFAAAAEDSDEELFAIIIGGRLAGVIGFKNTDWNNERSEIGYWLSPEFQRRGVMTRCVFRLCSYAFDELGLHRLVIKCAVGNVPSRLIPIKLGFLLEGVEKDGELLSDGKFTDIEVYAKTRHNP